MLSLCMPAVHIFFLPKSETIPQRTQIIKQRPIEFDADNTLFGETKIPEPI